jgi:Zn-dependent protease with chaperone function
MGKPISTSLKPAHSLQLQLWVGLLALLGEVGTGSILGAIATGIVFYYGFHPYSHYLLAPLCLLGGYVGWQLWRSRRFWRPPAGIVLQLQDSPRLWDWVAQLQNTVLLQSRQRSNRKQDCGKQQVIHHILLTDDFNANLVQLPLWGGLGGHRNYLLIGLPMLYALTPGQFRAILAHELGHLHHQHGFFTGWIYRRYQRHAVLLNHLQSGRPSTVRGLLIQWLQWYVPYLGKLFFAVAQADEYRADRYAADCTNISTIAAALMQLHIKASYLTEKFWPGLFDLAAYRPDPPQQLFALVGEALQTQVDDAEAAQWLQEALTQSTRLNETHPCLRDRLDALGVVPEQVQLKFPLHQTAAAVLLGDKLPHYTTLLSQEWFTKIRFQWRSRYTQLQRQSQAGSQPHLRSVS